MFGEPQGTKTGEFQAICVMGGLCAKGSVQSKQLGLQVVYIAA